MIGEIRTRLEPEIHTHPRRRSKASRRPTGSTSRGGPPRTSAGRRSTCTRRADAPLRRRLRRHDQALGGIGSGVPAAARARVFGHDMLNAYRQWPVRHPSHSGTFVARPASPSGFHLAMCFRRCRVGLAFQQDRRRTPGGPEHPSLDHRRSLKSTTSTTSTASTWTRWRTRRSKAWLTSWSCWA